MIIEKVVVGELETNCYIVGCKETKKVVIIDPGAEGIKIKNKIKGLELKPQLIILTHAHFDHVGAVKDLKVEYKIPLYLHRAELQSYDQDEVDYYLEEGMLIKVGNLKLEIMHLPGHSPGSIGVKYQNHLFSGDTLFKGSIGRTDLLGGSSSLLRETIKNKILTLDENTIIYPGHGLETTLKTERLNNIFLK